MKYSKVAAVVAGSVMAVGVAAPAFADSSVADGMSTMPMSINGGVDQALAQQPLQKSVDNTEIGGTLDTVTGAAHTLGHQTQPDTLLGQAAGAAKSGPLSTVTGLLSAGSLLGGLPLGGLGGG